MIKRNYSWVNIFAFLIVVIAGYKYGDLYFDRKQIYVLFGVFTIFVFFWGWICGKKSGHGKPIKFDDLEEGTSFLVVRPLQTNLFGGERCLCRLENGDFAQIDFMFDINSPPFIGIQVGKVYCKKNKPWKGVLSVRFLDSFYMEEVHIP